MNNWNEKLAKLQQASKDLNDDLKSVTKKVNELNSMSVRMYY